MLLASNNRADKEKIDNLYGSRLGSGDVLEIERNLLKNQKGERAEMLMAGAGTRR